MVRKAVESVRPKKAIPYTDNSIHPLFFNESSKLYFDLHDKIEEETFDKNNENLKYLNDVGGIFFVCKSSRAKT